MSSTHVRIPTIGVNNTLVKDRIGSETMAMGGLGFANRNLKDENDKDTDDYYEASGYIGEETTWFSFITPEFYTGTWAFVVRLFLVELIAITFYLLPVYLAQGYINAKYGLTTATPLSISSEDYALLATVRAFSFFIWAYVFSQHANTGVHLNCAVSFGMSCLGLDSWFSTLVRWIAQFAGSSLAFVLSFGFLYVTSVNPWGTDAGVGVAQANSGSHSSTYMFLWEFLVSTGLGTVVLTLFATQRLYDDAYEAKMTASRPSQDLKGLPAEYHRHRYPAYTFQTLAIVALFIWCASYGGNIATEGNGIAGNFFFAWPRYFNVEKISNWDSANPIAAQGASNFFTPFLGMLAAVVLVAPLVVLTKWNLRIKNDGGDRGTYRFPPYIY